MLVLDDANLQIADVPPFSDCMSSCLQVTLHAAHYDRLDLNKQEIDFEQFGMDH